MIALGAGGECFNKERDTATNQQEHIKGVLGMSNTSSRHSL